MIDVYITTTRRSTPEENVINAKTAEKEFEICNICFSDKRQPNVMLRIEHRLLSNLV